MKHLTVLIAAFFAALSLAAVATADNGATATPFKASYGTFTCSGANIVKTAPKAFVKDSETCIDAAGPADRAPGTYDLGPGGWISDYYLFAATPSTVVFDTSATLVVTLNAEGTTTWNIVAYY
jgi:hypothetical protein